MVIMTTTETTPAPGQPAALNRIPPALRAAALDHYAATYGRSVLELDQALAAAPGPARPDRPDPR